MDSQSRGRPAPSNPAGLAQHRSVRAGAGPSLHTSDASVTLCPPGDTRCYVRGMRMLPAPAHRHAALTAVATAAVSLAACVLTAAPAAAVPGGAPTPPTGAVTKPKVADVRLPATGCVTVKAKVRVDVEGDATWTLASLLNHTTRASRVDRVDTQGRGDRTFTMKHSLCAGDVRGSWKMQEVLWVATASTPSGVSEKALVVRAPRR